jgi:hypothetical protein
MSDQGAPLITLREYVEVRFNLMDKAASEQSRLFQELMDKQAKRYDQVLEERDTRYQQRFEATEKHTALGFGSAEKAITKAEMATEKRFEGVNEFRAQLDMQQRTYMPRTEVAAMEVSVMNRLGGLEKQIDAMIAKEQGVKGGWGYAVGVVGFVLALASLIMVLVQLKG